MKQQKTKAPAFPRWTKELGIADVLVFAVVAAVCFLCFQQRDLRHTVGCSVGYLNGHILDFYDYCGTFDIHPSYMPTVYVLFAIWNIPTKLLGFLDIPGEEISTAAGLWSKALPCTIYLLSGIVVYRICMELGMRERRSKYCAAAFLTMPVGFYVQFIFGQYDIFMTACVLMGVWCFLRKKDIWFIFWFALAMTFKYTALVVFLPMLLLREKRVWHIVVSCLLLMVPFAIEYLVYRGSPGFLDYTFGLGSSGDNPTGYLFNLGYFTGYQLSARSLMISPVVLFYGLILGKAYFTRTSTLYEETEWVFYLSCMSFFVLFGLSKWHPQWLLLAVPFWVISAYMQRDTEIFLVIDLLFMIFFIMFIVQVIPGNVDQEMFNPGILGGLVNHRIGTERMMRDYIGILGDELCLSLVTMIMLVYGVYKHPKYLRQDPSTGGSGIGWMRARFLIGVAFFVIPAFLCLRAALTSPDPGYSLTMAEMNGAVPMREVGDSVTQRFRAEGDRLQELHFPVVVNGRQNDGYLKLTLRDEEGTVLYEEDWETDSLVDGDLLKAMFGGIPARKGHFYDAEFEVTQANGDFLLSLPFRTVEKSADEYAFVDGARQEYRVAMTVYESGMK